MWIPRIFSTSRQASMVAVASWSTRVKDAEGIQKGVGADLPGETAGHVLRTACIYSFINIKIHVLYPFCLDWALK